MLAPPPCQDNLSVVQLPGDWIRGGEEEVRDLSAEFCWWFDR